MSFFAALLLSLAASGSAWTDAASHYAQGPVDPGIDLRTMLTKYVVRRSCEALDAAAAARARAFESGDWKAWRESVRTAVREGLGPMPFGAEGGPLNVREVNAQDRPGYRLENVLFDSLPGLDVNASVFLPLAKDFPPPWPAIVVPVGHDTKTKPIYQHPAQVFARRGYAAITFDPPGMSGEKQPGNDHFRDGVRCYLTGQSSNRYFVIDALRCIDYLATRPDIDLSSGVGMTGVSGGGMTTMFAALLDDRITASGPSCCAVPLALHPILDGYAPCPETLAFGRLRAYDDVDVLVAAMPTPVLLMAGATDEVFTASMSHRIAEEVKASFAKGGSEEKFSFFLDPGGHAYTVAMAEEFADWMDRWVRGTPGAPARPYSESDLEVLPAEAMACKPRLDTSMFTVNRDEAAAQRAVRDADVVDAARELAGVTLPVRVPEEVLAGPETLVWFHQLQEVILKPEPGIALPATFLYPARPGVRSGAVLYFDDRGRWTDLRTQGWLTRLIRFIERGPEGFALLSVDLRGWGDTRPADERYDLAGWGARERWIEYVTSALGDPVMAMRIRDGLSALAYLRGRPEIDPARIVVGGRGQGGIVALHVAAIDGGVAGGFSLDSLASFESLAQSEHYRWTAEAFYPRVLARYDLAELASALKIPFCLGNPLDAESKPVPESEIKMLYTGATLIHAPGPGEAEIIAFTQELLKAAP